MSYLIGGYILGLLNESHPGAFQLGITLPLFKASNFLG